ncbi:MAG: hypothetical protein AB8G23_22060 [Myxococcota bacterium]
MMMRSGIGNVGQDRSGGSALRRMRAIGGAILFTLSCSLCLVPSLAMAQIELECLEIPLPPGCVSYEFEFEAQNVTDPFSLLSGVGFGSLISGSITLNTNVQDLDPSDPDRGVYPGAVECARIQFDNEEIVLVQETFVPSISDPADDPGYQVANDLIDPEAPISPEIDVVAGSIGGLGLRIPVDGDALSIGGGFAFAYGEGCLDVPFSPFPCPPMLLVDDSIPGAPGQVSLLQASPVELLFTQIEGLMATARVDGQLLTLDAADDIPCPEPGFGLALAAGVMTLASFQRRRQ